MRLRMLSEKTGRLHAQRVVSGVLYGGDIRGLGLLKSREFPTESGRGQDARARLVHVVTLCSRVQRPLLRVLRIEEEPTTF